MRIRSHRIFYSFIAALALMDDAVIAQSVDTVCAEFTGHGELGNGPTAKTLGLSDSLYSIQIRGFYKYTPSSAQAGTVHCWLYSQVCFSQPLFGGTWGLSPTSSSMAVQIGNHIWRTPKAYSNLALTFIQSAQVPVPVGLQANYEVSAQVTDLANPTDFEIFNGFGNGSFPRITFQLEGNDAYGLNTVPMLVPRFSAFWGGLIEFSAKASDGIFQGYIDSLKDCTAQTASGNWEQAASQMVRAPSAPALQMISPADTDPKAIIQASVPAGVTVDLGSISLVRYTDAGLQQTTTMGQMYDDGTHGDVEAGDGIFTATVNAKDLPPNTYVFGASAKIGLSPTPTVSPVGIITIAPAQTCEDFLRQVATDVAAGPIDRLRLEFSTEDAAQRVVVLSAASRQALAAGLRSAQLQQRSRTNCVFQISIPNGSKTQQVSMETVRSYSGDWTIVNW